MDSIPNMCIESNRIDHGTYCNINHNGDIVGIPFGVEWDAFYMWAVFKAAFGHSMKYWLLAGWWFQPLWKILKSVGMMKFSIYGNIKAMFQPCSKPPPRYMKASFLPLPSTRMGKCILGRYGSVHPRDTLNSTRAGEWMFITKMYCRYWLAYQDFGVWRVISATLRSKKNMAGWFISWKILSIKVDD